VGKGVGAVYGRRRRCSGECRGGIGYGDEGVSNGDGDEEIEDEDDEVNEMSEWMDE
jgi:hypothetical protein